MLSFRYLLLVLLRDRAQNSGEGSFARHAGWKTRMVPGVVFSGLLGGLGGLGWSLFSGHDLIAVIFAYPGFGLLCVMIFIAAAELRRLVFVRF